MGPSIGAMQSTLDYKGDIEKVSMTSKEMWDFLINAPQKRQTVNDGQKIDNQYKSADMMR